MNIFIMAAGQGTRLKPHTDKYPKCLVNVAEHPILEWQLEQIKLFKPDNIYLVVGYKANDIKEWVKKQKYDFEIKFIDNPNYATSNNLYSLKLCLPYFNKKNIIINGDIIFHRDILKQLYTTSGNSIATIKKWLDDDDMKAVIKDEQVIFLNKVVESGIEHDRIEQALGLYRIENTKELALNLLALPETEYFNTAISGMLDSCIFKPVDITNFPAIEIDFPEDLDQANDMFRWGVQEWDLGIRQGSPVNKNIALKLLVDFRNLMAQFKIPWFVCFGTALGFYRDKGFIPHDTDMDIGIYLEDKEKFIKLIEPKLRELGCYVPFVDNHYYDRWIIRDNEKIEVHCFETIDDMRIYDIYRCGFRFPAKMINNLVSIEVYKEKFSIPSDTDKFMELSYGSTWKTPQGSKDNHINTSQIKKSKKLLKYLYVDKFDPLILDDINLINKLNQLGKSIILVRSDEYLQKYKIRPIFQLLADRFQSVRHLNCVQTIEKARDVEDYTIRQDLEEYKPDFYVTVGEIKQSEKEFCDLNNIKMITREDIMKQEVD